MNIYVDVCRHTFVQHIHAAVRRQVRRRGVRGDQPRLPAERRAARVCVAPRARAVAPRPRPPVRRVDAAVTRRTFWAHHWAGSCAHVCAGTGARVGRPTISHPPRRRLHASRMPSQAARVAGVVGDRRVRDRRRVPSRGDLTEPRGPCVVDPRACVCVCVCERESVCARAAACAWNARRFVWLSLCVSVSASARVPEWMCVCGRGRPLVG